MTTQLFAILLIGAVLAVNFVIALTAWLRVRGTRIVSCPETHKPAAVRVDAGHAAVTAVWEKADLRLTACARWPERAGCDQACTAQIVQAPQETRARTIAGHFFEGARCAICRHGIEPIHGAMLQPGLLDPVTRDMVAWDEVPAEQLFDVFMARLPICANCTLAESLRRRFPDRLLERSPRAGIDGAIDGATQGWTWTPDRSCVSNSRSIDKM
jgi:hypothetical protein